MRIPKILILKWNLYFKQIQIFNLFLANNLKNIKIKKNNVSSYLRANIAGF